jgi:CRISPR-associated protein Cas2
MSERRSVIVCYDIRNPKRLRHVHKTMKAHGTALQFSIFHCELNALERERLLSKLTPQIDHSEDSVLFVDLGPIGPLLSDRIDYLGQRPADPHRGPRIF